MKVPILIPNIFDHPFTYDSNSLNLDKGNYVIVPFGLTKITGIVWDKFEKAEKKFGSGKVIVKVFSSLTCPHCANFHLQVCISRYGLGSTG